MKGIERENTVGRVNTWVPGFFTVSQDHLNGTLNIVMLDANRLWYVLLLSPYAFQGICLCEYVYIYKYIYIYNVLVKHVNINTPCVCLCDYSLAYL